MARDSSNVLHVEDVVLSRGAQVVARLPDLHLARGHTAALTGSSGAGKTTALLALAGVHAPKSGRILIEATNLWTLPHAERDRMRGRRIGLVFQSFHLIDAVSVEANLCLAATCAGLKPDLGRINLLLERLDIAALRHIRADKLSQGQAQRVAVARALVNRPALVLADEPTSALDDDNATALLALLKRVAEEEGAALLIATHDRRVMDNVEQAIAMEPCL